MPLAPRSAMPIPENATLPSSIPVGHFLVLFSTVLAFTSKPLTGWPGKASKNMPAQLSWIVFPAMEPPLVLATQTPHGPPETRLPTTLASLLARSGPKMVMPVLPERLTSLARILVPVESTIAMPPKVLSVMSLARILVPGESPTNRPTQLFSRSFFATVVAMAPSTIIALWSPSGMFLTSLFTILVLRESSPTTIPSELAALGLATMWFFAMVVSMFLPRPIAPEPLPTKRFPTMAASRAPGTSIAKVTSFVCSKPRNVKPETPTSFTRDPVSLPFWRFTPPSTQMPSAPKTFEQGESALDFGGASITASSPRSLIPFLWITTSSRWTPRTTIVSPGSAAFMAFWMDSPGPTTELCAPAEPILVTARATPLATNTVRAMVVNNTMVRLIRRPAFLQGGGVSSVVRLHSRRPGLSSTFLPWAALSRSTHRHDQRHHNQHDHLPH